MVEAAITWNYTSWLNLAFLLLAGLLVGRFLKTGGAAMLRRMNGPAGHEGKPKPQQFCDFHEPSEVPSGLDNGLILDSLSRMFADVNHRPDDLSGERASCRHKGMQALNVKKDSPKAGEGKKVLNAVGLGADHLGNGQRRSGSHLYKILF